VKAVADKEKLSTMLFISMSVINGPQLVLRMEKQRVFRLMIMKNRMRRNKPNINIYKCLSTIFCQYIVHSICYKLALKEWCNCKQ
jgi:hypothetical protein